MLKFEKSLEHETQVKIDAIKLAAFFLEGSDYQVKPKDLTAIAEIIITSLKNCHDKLNKNNPKKLQ